LKEPHNTKVLCFQSCHVATLGDHPQEHEPNLAIGKKENNFFLKNPIIFWQLTGSWNLLSKYGNFKFLFSFQNQVTLMHFLLKNPLGELQWISSLISGENKSESFFSVIKVPFKIVCYFTK